MKFIFNILIIFIIVIVLAFVFFGKQILETVGTYVIKTEVNINNVKFIPYKFLFRLNGIEIKSKKVFFPTGTVSLFPLNMHFNGINFDNNILSEDDFFIDILRHDAWEIEISFQNLKLNKIDKSFIKGSVKGNISGKYNGIMLFLSGIFYINNIVYTGGGVDFLNISKEEVMDLIEKHDGNLQLDFTYKGPIEGMDNINNYKPGAKTMQLIGSYIVRRILS